MPLQIVGTCTTFCTSMVCCNGSCYVAILNLVGVIFSSGVYMKYLNFVQEKKLGIIPKQKCSAFTIKDFVYNLIAMVLSVIRF